jgi:flavin-dependent dehydrogenase
VGDPLEGELEADLLVVGGGPTGLWAALLAKEDDPAREVVLLEGERIAFGASGRNGGFMDASLTRGIENGASRWPDEMPHAEVGKAVAASPAERATAVGVERLDHEHVVVDGNDVAPYAVIGG